MLQEKAEAAAIAVERTRLAGVLHNSVKQTPYTTKERKRRQLIEQL